MGLCPARVSGFWPVHAGFLGFDRERGTGTRVGGDGGHGHGNRVGGVGWLKAFRLFLSAAAVTTIFQTAAWAQGSEEAEGAAAEPRAWVIELLVEGRDTVPIRATERHRGGKHPLAWFEDGGLVLDPETMSQSKAPELARLLRFDDDLQDLAEVAVVIIERRRFLGQYRRGQITIIWARRELPAFPLGQPPEEVLITPFGTKPSLEGVIAWPEAVWHIENAEEGGEGSENKDAPLLVIETAGERKELPPGETLAFEPIDWRIPVTLGRFKPVPVGAADEALETFEQDLGEAVFSTEVTVRFHGRMALRMGR